MNIEKVLKDNILVYFQQVYNTSLDEKNIQIQETNRDFAGDVTVVVFPMLRITKKSPEQTAIELGAWLKENLNEIADYNAVKGFLNLTVSNTSWLSALNSALATNEFGIKPVTENSTSIMVEYSSPNTNKPLHLGHVRNNLLGYSVAEILKANGNNVIKVNLVNDRGIHICKSMLAWVKWGNGETPQSSGKKGDHLVGEYYVKFSRAYDAEILELMSKGLTDKEAVKQSTLMAEAQEMLVKWEAKDAEIINLWKTMNGWVYKGFEETYKKLGVDFHKVYYESETYLLGKKNVNEGLEKGVLFQKEDGSVWIDLTGDGLDQKLLLRADGTSVYMTQDIGTAITRHEEFDFEKLVYVVGNEQEYHFKVLSLILQKLGYSWAKNLYHLSYGMVELPEGKLKSREGKVVDADNLIDDMITTAREKAGELGKLDGYSTEEKEEIFRIVGLGALKFFILKVDPRKNMLFNPEESIDINGHTGPFIQYTYARIQSLLRKAENSGIIIKSDVSESITVSEKESQLIQNLLNFPETINDAASKYSPALIAAYIYDLVKEFNQFYHDFQVLREEDETLRDFRLTLSKFTGEIIARGMKLLGIEVPDRM